MEKVPDIIINILFYGGYATAAVLMFWALIIEIRKMIRNHKNPEKKLKRVILESPFAGKGLRGNASPEERAMLTERNIEYARRCLRDSLLRDEAPIASHLLYTQPGVLNDNDPEERKRGITAGLAWGVAAEATVVYVDLGVSTGMQYGIDRAKAEGRPVEIRKILS